MKKNSSDFYFQSHSLDCNATCKNSSQQFVALTWVYLDFGSKIRKIIALYDRENLILKKMCERANVCVSVSLDECECACVSLDECGFACVSVRVLVCKLKCEFASVSLDAC